MTTEESKTVKRHQESNPYHSPSSEVSARKFSKASYSKSALAGALVGFSIPAVVLGLFITVEVLSGARYQGQLYHEDGPVAFFVIYGGLLVVSGAVFTVVGAFLGLVVCEILNELRLAIFKWKRQEFRE